LENYNANKFITSLASSDIDKIKKVKVSDKIRPSSKGGGASTSMGSSMKLKKNSVGSAVNEKVDFNFTAVMG
jgi:hypothetical protein